MNEKSGKRNKYASERGHTYDCGRTHSGGFYESKKKILKELQKIALGGKLPTYEH